MSEHKGVVDLIRSLSNKPEREPDREPLAERDNPADWNADNSDVREAGFHYHDDMATMRCAFDDVQLHIHTTPDGEVRIIADNPGDDWRDVSITLGPDAAERVAEQLEFAAGLAREERSADIRT